MPLGTSREAPAAINVCGHQGQRKGAGRPRNHTPPAWYTFDLRLTRRRPLTSGPAPLPSRSASSPARRVSSLHTQSTNRLAGSGMNELTVAASRAPCPGDAG